MRAPAPLLKRYRTSAETTLRFCWQNRWLLLVRFQGTRPQPSGRSVLDRPNTGDHYKQWKKRNSLPDTPRFPPLCGPPHPKYTERPLHPAAPQPCGSFLPSRSGPRFSQLPETSEARPSSLPNNALSAIFQPGQWRCPAKSLLLFPVPHGSGKSL